jgi:hypothetical protein
VVAAFGYLTLLLVSPEAGEMGIGLRLNDMYIQTDRFMCDTISVASSHASKRKQICHIAIQAGMRM